MKSFFAVVGAFVTVLFLLGSFGIGNFYVYYGPEKNVCADGKNFRFDFKDAKDAFEENSK